MTQQNRPILGFTWRDFLFCTPMGDEKVQNEIQPVFSLNTNVLNYKVISNFVAI